jgi:signal transduction histidine kinase
MAPEWVRLVVAMVCAVSGLVAWLRGLAPAAAGLLVACAVLLVPSGASPTASTAHFTVSMVATPLAPLCGAVAALWWPVLPLTVRLLRVGAVVLAAGLGAGLMHAVALDPAAEGCFQCPPNLLAVPAASRHAVTFDRAAAVLVALASLTVVAAAVERWWRSPPLARRTTWLILSGGAGLAGLGAAHSVHVLTQPQDLYDSWARPVDLAQLALLLVLATGVWWRIWMPRLTADRVGRRVLAATPDPASLVASLARAIADPDLVVTYCRPDGSRIDLKGHPVAAPPDRAVLRLTRDGVAYAELWFSARLDAESDVVRAVADSSGLALEYVAAQARLRAETLDAVAARRRVVAAADAERGRLERDLHDGAQQGLIALSLELAGVAAGHGGDRVAEAQREISLALRDLRTVARGLFPVSLGESGLVAALRELGDHTPVPLVVEGSLVGPPGSATELAFFAVVIDVVTATREAPGAAVWVALDGGADGPTRVRARATPVDPEQATRLLVRAEDRVAALGGTLTAEVAGSTLLVEGEVPCAS